MLGCARGVFGDADLDDEAVFISVIILLLQAGRLFSSSYSGPDFGLKFVYIIFIITILGYFTCIKVVRVIDIKIGEPPYISLPAISSVHS